MPAVGSAGGALTLAVTSQANCPLSVTGTNSWISLKSSSLGTTGQDSAVLAVQPNTGKVSRSVNLTIGNKTVAVEQNGTGT